jgi:acetyl-CoA carboxylase carboxyl transferase subunit alpha
MSISTFDFEKPLLEFEARVQELEKADPPDESALAEAREQLRRKQIEVYSHLSPWQRVLLARHNDRPRSLDFVSALMTDFVELHGDRAFADDKACITGFATFRGKPIAVVAQQKGKDTSDNIHRNWGMSHPEGYRKAMRVMRLAEKFGLPVIVFIDTPGAFPGIGAEERGQAEAIARNIRDMFTVRTTIICLVIGEGASGGALGVGVGDSVLMMENAWYCVISPEGCAAILWKDRAMAGQAAENLRLTAPDLLELGIIDEIVPEPLGGAHRDRGAAFQHAGDAIHSHLQRLAVLDTEELLNRRYEKFRNMGRCLDLSVEQDESDG